MAHLLLQPEGQGLEASILLEVREAFNNSEKLKTLTQSVIALQNGLIVISKNLVNEYALELCKVISRNWSTFFTCTIKYAEPNDKWGKLTWAQRGAGTNSPLGKALSEIKSDHIKKLIAQSVGNDEWRAQSLNDKQDGPNTVYGGKVYDDLCRKVRAIFLTKLVPEWYQWLHLRPIPKENWKKGLDFLKEKKINANHSSVQDVQIAEPVLQPPVTIVPVIVPVTDGRPVRQTVIAGHLAEATRYANLATVDEHIEYKTDLRRRAIEVQLANAAVNEAALDAHQVVTIPLLTEQEGQALPVISKPEDICHVCLVMCVTGAIVASLCGGSHWTHQECLAHQCASPKCQNKCAQCMREMPITYATVGEESSSLSTSSAR